MKLVNVILSFGCMVLLLWKHIFKIYLNLFNCLIFINIIKVNFNAFCSFFRFFNKLLSDVAANLLFSCYLLKLWLCIIVYGYDNILNSDRQNHKTINIFQRSIGIRIKVNITQTFSVYSLKLQFSEIFSLFFLIQVNVLQQPYK